MELTTRTERITFDIRRDLEARRRICSFFKGYMVRKANTSASSTELIRTEAFIECKCGRRYSKYVNKCDVCDKELSTRPHMWRVM